MTRKCRDFSAPGAPESQQPSGRRADRVWPARLGSLSGLWRIDSFALDEHRDEFLDARHPGLGLFSAVDPVKDRVSIGAVERFEEASCFLVSRKGSTEILRHLRRALRRIGGVPAAVLLGAFDFVRSCRLHAPQLHEFKRPGSVFLRPFAGGLTRREADQPVIVVETVELAVDPAMTKRRINRLRL